MVRDVTSEYRGANLLLTSAGPTTEASQERLLEMAKEVQEPGRPLRVLQIEDGRSPIGPVLRGSGFVEYVTETIPAFVWTHTQRVKTLNKVKLFNSVDLVHARFARMDHETAEDQLKRADMIWGPGGNTFRMMAAIQRHRGLFIKEIAEGKPYFGESAGTIIAGETTRPAGLEPADKMPEELVGIEQLGLGLVTAEFVVHAEAERGGFAIDGPVSMFAAQALRSWATTPKSEVDRFRLQIANDNTQIVTLSDHQSCSLRGGQLTRNEPVVV